MRTSDLTFLTSMIFLAVSLSDAGNTWTNVFYFITLALFIVAEVLERSIEWLERP